MFTWGSMGVSGGLAGTGLPLGGEAEIAAALLRVGRRDICPCSSALQAQEWRDEGGMQKNMWAAGAAGPTAAPWTGREKEAVGDIWLVVLLFRSSCFLTRETHITRYNRSMSV